MPKKYPITVKREWLQFIETGEKTEVNIVTEARQKGLKLDIKTVRSGIEDARNELYIRKVREEILKDKLLAHHDCLMEVVNRLLVALVLPEPAIASSRDKNDASTPQVLPESRITYDKKTGLVLSFTDENTLQWELLREHLKYERIWKHLEKWKMTMISHFQARTKLRLQLEFKLDNCFESENGDVSESQPSFFSSSVGYLFQALVVVLLNRYDISSLTDMIQSDHDEGVIRLESHTLIKLSDPKEIYRGKINEAISKVAKSNESNQLVSTYEDIRNPMAKCRSYLEEISLVGMLPRTCRVCRRIGIK